jgi:2'-5' RNA ligase
MNADILNNHAYRYAEYLVVLNPHEELRNRIMSVRKEFFETHHAVTGGRPNILLAKFIVWEMMEEKIVSRIKVAAMGTAPFKVQLKDYGSFPTHTIFINVISKIPVQNLVKDLKKSQRLMKSPDHDPYFITDPIIPIARKLKAFQFEQGWLEYSHRSFSGSFIADGLLLLKKHEGDKGYQIVERFLFMNLPINTKQGQLF